MHSLKWKKYNDFIEVSEAGDVKSHGKLIKGEIVKAGYRRIHVSHEGKSYKFFVHRLVAEAFIDNPEKLPVVNHKDGNKLNNSVNNLEWITYSGNLSHAYRTGLRSSDGELNSMSKLTLQEVKEIRSLYEKRGKNNSYVLAKTYGVSPRTILGIVRGESWKVALEGSSVRKRVSR